MHFYIDSWNDLFESHIYSMLHIMICQRNFLKVLKLRIQTSCAKLTAAKACLTRPCPFFHHKASQTIFLFDTEHHLTVRRERPVFLCSQCLKLVSRGPQFLHSRNNHIVKILGLLCGLKFFRFENGVFQDVDFIVKYCRKIGNFGQNVAFRLYIDSQLFFRKGGTGQLTAVRAIFRLAISIIVRASMFTILQKPSILIPYLA